MHRRGDRQGERPDGQCGPIDLVIHLRHITNWLRGKMIYHYPVATLRNLIVYNRLRVYVCVHMCAGAHVGMCVYLCA